MKTPLLTQAMNILMIEALAVPKKIKNILMLKPLLGNTNRILGICMDHEKANLMEFVNNTMIDTIITSDLTPQLPAESYRVSEKHMNTKEQQLMKLYYKKITTKIKPFKHVLLFGATTAKTELYNSFISNPLFSKIKFEIVNTDIMTTNQMHAFVRDFYFQKKVK